MYICIENMDSATITPQKDIGNNITLPQGLKVTYKNGDFNIYYIVDKNKRIEAFTKVRRRECFSDEDNNKLKFIEV